VDFQKNVGLEERVLEPLILRFLLQPTLSADSGSCSNSTDPTHLAISLSGRKAGARENVGLEIPLSNIFKKSPLTPRTHK
jgi:hypothetical protein